MFFKKTIIYFCSFSLFFVHTVGAFPPGSDSEGDEVSTHVGPPVLTGLGDGMESSGVLPIAQAGASSQVMEPGRVATTDVEATDVVDSSLSSVHVRTTDPEDPGSIVSFKVDSTVSSFWEDAEGERIAEPTPGHLRGFRRFRVFDVTSDEGRMQLSKTQYLESRVAYETTDWFYVKFYDHKVSDYRSKPLFLRYKQILPIIVPKVTRSEIESLLTEAHIDKDTVLGMVLTNYVGINISHYVRSKPDWYYLADRIAHPLSIFSKTISFLYTASLIDFLPVLSHGEIETLELVLFSLAALPCVFSVAAMFECNIDDSINSLKANLYYLNAHVDRAWHKRILNFPIYTLPSLLVAITPAQAWSIANGSVLGVRSVFGSISLAIPTFITTSAFLSRRLAYSGISEVFAKDKLINFCSTRASEERYFGRVMGRLHKFLQDTSEAKEKRALVLGRLYNVIQNFDQNREELESILGSYSPSKGDRNSPLEILSRLLRVGGDSVVKLPFFERYPILKLFLSAPALPFELAVNTYAISSLASQIIEFLFPSSLSALTLTLPSILEVSATAWLVGALISLPSSLIRGLEIGQAILDLKDTFVNAIKISFFGSKLQFISLFLLPTIFSIPTTVPKVFLAREILRIFIPKFATYVVIPYGAYEFVTNWQGYVSSMLDTFIKNKDGKLKRFLPGGIFSKVVAHTLIFGGTAAVALTFSAFICLQGLLINVSSDSRGHGRSGFGHFAVAIANALSIPVYYYFVQKFLNYNTDKSLKSMKAILERLNIRKFLNSLTKTVPIMDLRSIRFVDTLRVIPDTPDKLNERERADKVLSLFETNTSGDKIIFVSKTWDFFKKIIHNPFTNLVILIICFFSIGFAMFTFTTSLFPQDIAILS